MFKEILIGEYANYLIDDKGDLFTYDNSVLVKIPMPEKVKKGGAAHPWASIIGVSGQVYLALGDSLTWKTVPITNGAESTSGIWEYHAVVKTDGKISMFKNDLTVFLELKAPVGVKFVKVIAGHYLLALTDTGDVYSYTWCSAPRVWKTATELSQLNPVKINLPGAATDIATSRNMYSIAIVNGEPYGWCDTFGARYLGLAGATTTPVNLKTTWGLTEKIVSIESSDNTTHMITETSKLLGVGDAAIGELGNGQKHPQVLATSNWDMAWQLIVTKAVNIGKPGIKYTKISKGNSYGFRLFVQEENGQWSSCGYGKFGLLLNGIRPVDDINNMEHSVATIRRIVTPSTLTIITTQQLKAMYAAGTYPPAEAPYIPIEVPNQPPTVNVGADLQFTLPLTSFTLAGSAGDLEGQIVSVAWTQTQGVPLIISNDSSLVTLIQGNFQPGTYTFKLEVTDDKGAKASDSINITINPKPKTLVATINVYDNGDVEKV